MRSCVRVHSAVAHSGASPRNLSEKSLAGKSLAGKISRREISPRLRFRVQRELGEHARHVEAELGVRGERARKETELLDAPGRYELLARRRRLCVMHTKIRRDAQNNSPRCTKQFAETKCLRVADGCVGVREA